MYLSGSGVSHQLSQQKQLQADRCLSRIHLLASDTFHSMVGLYHSDRLRIPIRLSTLRSYSILPLRMLDQHTSPHHRGAKAMDRV